MIRSGTGFVWCFKYLLKKKLHPVQVPTPGHVCRLSWSCVTVVTYGHYLCRVERHSGDKGNRTGGITDTAIPPFLPHSIPTIPMYASKHCNCTLFVKRAFTPFLILFTSRLQHADGVYT